MLVMKPKPMFIFAQRAQPDRSGSRATEGRIGTCRRPGASNWKVSPGSATSRSHCFLRRRNPKEEGTLRQGEAIEPLGNEFALVSVGVARVGSEEALLIRDMNACQAVFLRAHELEALLRARHRGFGPLVDKRPRGDPRSRHRSSVTDVIRDS